MLRYYKSITKNQESYLCVSMTDYKITEVFKVTSRSSLKIRISYYEFTRYLDVHLFVKNLNECTSQDFKSAYTEFISQIIYVND